MTDKTAWGWVVFTAIVLAFSLFFLHGGFAADYSNVDPKVREWYSKQKITPEARTRLGVTYESCCDDADRYLTRFRLVNDGSKYGAETYEYWKIGEGWIVLSPDIIQHKQTPDGQPVLFIQRDSGKPLCLIIDSEGG